LTPAPSRAGLAACRDHFVASTTHLAALDARLRTERSTAPEGARSAWTPEDLLPRAIGWTLREHGPRYFRDRLRAHDAAALTRTLRTVAGTPPAGCCGEAGANDGCYDCGALSATARSEDPALLFDLALTVLGWVTPGGGSTSGH
jgi:hypothetical protein